MSDYFKKSYDSQVCSEVDHVKPVRIFLYDDRVVKKKEEVSDEDKVFPREFEEKYNWIVNWFWKK